MTTALVVGGTGTAGSAAARALRSRGYLVRVLSRHAPPDPAAAVGHVRGDLSTGEGLPEALAGVEVLVSAVDGRSRKARPVFTDGARNLVRAAEAAGVRRAVLLSIVGVDRPAFAYYQALTEQERIYSASAPDVRVVRSTQFHSFLSMIFRPAARGGLVPAFTDVSFQPIAPADVGRALADAALSEAPGPDGPIEVGGPEVLTMRELAATWKRVTGSRARVVDVPLPGEFGRFLRAGGNLTPENRYGRTTFAQWLAAG